MEVEWNASEFEIGNDVKDMGVQVQNPLRAYPINQCAPGCRSSFDRQDAGATQMLSRFQGLDGCGYET
jgi:hypothetical protein